MNVSELIDQDIICSCGKLSRLVNGEYLCPFVYQAVMGCTNEVRGLAHAIANRKETAIGRLIEILVLFGVPYTAQYHPARLWL